METSSPPTPIITTCSTNTSRSSNSSSTDLPSSTGPVQPGHAKITGHFSGIVLTGTHHLDVTLPIAYEVPYEVIQPALTAFADAEKQGNGGIETSLHKVWQSLMADCFAPDHKAARTSPDETLPQGEVTQTRDSILEAVTRERDKLKADLEAVHSLNGRIEHMVQVLSAKVQQVEKERIMEDDDLASLMHESTPSSTLTTSAQQDLHEHAHPARPAMELGHEVQEPASVEEYRQQLQALEQDSRLEIKRLNELLLRRSSELADERTDHAQQRAEAAKLRSKLAALTKCLSAAESSTGRLKRALGRAGLGHTRVATNPTLAMSQQQQQQQQQQEYQQQQPQLGVKSIIAAFDNSATMLTPRMAPVGNQGDSPRKGKGRMGVPKLHLQQELVADDSAKPKMLSIKAKNALHDDALVADLKDLTRWAHNCHRARKNP
eukprot:CAMPEP_0172672582 /NCGR_PEP_ID=MMETSP1074-20121228/11633_1 /TAXON_ID=2916 /ORGANISM="Ceratium fusus, Strain PA161109" /LENGTH=433 /DNA_ID=CAMNT_0013489789 /DNA_START=40 /DNA_END=1341 /DNA_ORIENTATION=+